MELKEKFTQLNAALFAMQIEISAIPDDALSAKMNVVLFALQMRIAKLYEEIKTDYAQKESSPLVDEDEHNEIYSPGIAFDCNPPLPAPATTTAESLPATAQSGSGLLLFTEKEIMKMPKSIRKSFRAHGCTVHYRERTTGRYNKSYEARYAKKPYDKRPISVSATTLIELKARFIEKLNSYVPPEEGAVALPKTFDGFASYWFENFHRRKVVEKTYKKNLATYRHDIQKVFENQKLADILPVQIQQFLEGFNEKERTKETLHSLLNQIFECAVKHGIVKLNPIDMCFYQKHEREHGVAISKIDEIRLLKTYKNTEFELDFAIILYTGLRPCEYKTVMIDGKFIKAQNGKRKGGKIEYKRIPISPMLNPYVDGVTAIKLHHFDTIADRLKRVLPTHTLKDMRTTFQTRCTESKVAEVAIGMFMGNGIGSELKKTYTDVSDEWLIAEGNKLSY